MDSKYPANMIAAAKTHATRILDATSYHEVHRELYYDAAWAFRQASKISLDKKLLRRASDKAAIFYMDYLEDSKWQVPGYWLFPKGVYYARGQERGVAVLANVAKDGLWTRSTTPDDDYYDYPRETALACGWLRFALQRQPSPSTRLQYTRLRGILQRIVREYAVGREMQPFMAAMVLKEARFSRSSLNRLKEQYLDGAFWVLEEGHRVPGPDTNLFIRPLFDNDKELFFCELSKSLDTHYWEGAKQFNQAFYYWRVRC